MSGKVFKRIRKYIRDTHGIDRKNMLNLDFIPENYVVSAGNKHPTELKAHISRAVYKHLKKAIKRLKNVC